MKRCITNLGATDPDYRLDRIAFMERKLGAFRYKHKRSLHRLYNELGKYSSRKSINGGLINYRKTYPIKYNTSILNLNYIAKVSKRNKNKNNPLLRGKPHEL